MAAGVLPANLDGRRRRSRVVTPDPDDADPAVLGQALLQAADGGPSVMAGLRGLLVSASRATDLTLYLVDYRLTALLPVDGRVGLLRAEPADGPFVGAAYRQQQAVPQTVPAGQLLHVPVTVRGQRLGVLTATFPGRPGPRDERVLRSVALATAHLLLATGTGSDLYEIGRRGARLSLAAEMQWQLLPARAYRTPRFYVAGHLEPALTVAGDAFDFAVDDTTVTLAVVDATATGRSGSSSALLSTLAVTALRNARRAQLPLTEQASLASDMVFQHTRGRQHAAVLLLQLDAGTGRAQAVDAGSGSVVRLRDGHAQQQALTRQPPLGLLDDMRYTTDSIDLAVGDRAYVLAASSRDQQRAVALLGQPQHRLPTPTPPESVRRLVDELLNGTPPEDDTTVVCLDWTSP